jgi:hypothetical protein
MVNRLIFIAIFAALGALAFGWWTNNSRISAEHQEKLATFVNAGPRFTADDGQALCLRIQALEQRLYGSGETSGPCEYRQ